MSNTMYDYIKETPSVCKNILNNRKEVVERFVDGLVKNDIHRIVLIACGSSYNAATSARLCMEKYLKMPVRLITPLMFIHYEQFYDTNDLILAITESGRSTATIDAVKKVVSQGLHCMVLTNNLHSPVTAECTEIIDLSCGVETVGYVTKGYTSTVLDLMLMGLEGARALKRIPDTEYQQAIDQISTGIQLMPEIIEATSTWYQANKAGLMATKRLMVVGYGPNFGTALEGALKIQETMGLASTAFELEDFLHGPNLELSANHSTILINTIGKVEKRLIDLKGLIDVITDKNYLITHGKANGNIKTVFIDHTIEEEISPLFLAIPFQLTAYFLCGDLGIDLNHENKVVEDIFTLSKKKKTE